MSWKLVTLELINAIISLCAGEIGCCTVCKFILINKFAYEFNGSFLVFNFCISSFAFSAFVFLNCLSILVELTISVNILIECFDI